MDSIQTGHVTLKVLLLVSSTACGADPVMTAGPAQETVIRPTEYGRALRNPLKGLTNRGFSEQNEWASLVHSYIRWNEIEDDEAHGIDRIRAWCDDRWQGLEQRNIKVIPRLYLHWSGDRKYWPADMVEDDYSSPQFRQRVLRLIERLGQVWDDDARVAHVEMGLIGKWGEHHSPGPDERMQQLLGNAFSAAFVHKQVLVRHPWEFVDFDFGIYWDSWAHANQTNHADGIFALGDRWQTRIMGGEVAYDWGDSRVQPGDSPTDTVSDPVHREHMIDTIRRLHGTQLRWVADYDETDAAARAGGEQVQKAFGYRFVIDEVRYAHQSAGGDATGSLVLSFAVRNTGSAPFYRDWPVEVSLLKPETREAVWSGRFADVDIRTWLPGDGWDAQARAYTSPAPTFLETGTFALSEDLVRGRYILALAILDPAGMLPAVRFAIGNYYTGGRHPIGVIGIGATVDEAELPADSFGDPRTDQTLHYIY